MAAARRRSARRSPVAVGLIALAIILVGVYLGFTKDIPFTKGFRVNAVFESGNSLRPNSPVRIAGVEVGKVKAVKPREGTDQALVEMEIRDAGLPIHEDATAKIRPRIFLEGNFFVDLRPGTPSSPKLESGDTIKVTRTSTPVQLDQVLTALQSDTRQDLRDLLDGLAQGLNSKPTDKEDREADRLARGQTAAESFNDAYRDTPAALRGAAQVNEALLGVEPERDVARLLDGTAKTTGALIRNEGLLKDLITNFNTTMAAFASEADNLQTSIRLLAPTLENANAALASLTRAFPPTRAFARDPPRRPRDRRHHRRLVPVDPADPPPALPGRAARARAGPLARDPRPRAPHQRLAEAVPADRPHVAVRARHGPAGRRHRGGRRVPDRRRELQGVLVDDGGPLGREPELRRQRLLRPLPAGRRRRHGRARQRQLADRPARRLDARPGDRRAAEVPGQAPAVQHEGPLP